MNSHIRVIITGATGMVGEGVLHECLQDDEIQEILVLGRKSCGISHPKLKEIIHGDLYNLSTIEKDLQNYNACFFCLGTTSLGKSEAEFHNISYTLTMHIASTLSRLNPDMTFCYISGSGTDSSEKGKIMWARVKGKTENDLLKLPFKKAYNFRPGYIHPIKGLQNTHSYYKYLGWLYPLLKFIMPNQIITLQELAKAMINVANNGYNKQILEVKDILILARR